MTAFRLPGMFAPKIHESAFGNSVASAISRQVSVQPASASGLGSMLRTPSRSAVHTGRMESAERDAVAEALREAGGNRTRAARSLGIGRNTLYHKMREFGLT